MYKFQTMRPSGTGTSFLDAFGQEGLDKALDEAESMLEGEHDLDKVTIFVHEVSDPKDWGAEDYKIEIRDDGSMRCLVMHWGTSPPEIRITSETLEERAGLKVAGDA
ncbi:MAG: hypothetical protein ABEN55_13510 [Bradymonadaceae bacterium]